MRKILNLGTLVGTFGDYHHYPRFDHQGLNKREILFLNPKKGTLFFS